MCSNESCKVEILAENCAEAHILTEEKKKNLWNYLYLAFTIEVSDNLYH